MGMSTYVCGIVPADEKFHEMKSIYDMCKKTGVEVPQEVWDFFDGDTPDAAGVVVTIDEQNSQAVTYYQADSREGFEVDISKLDPKFKIIRFVNSY